MAPWWLRTSDDEVPEEQIDVKVEEAADASEEPARLSEDPPEDPIEVAETPKEQETRDPDTEEAQEPEDEPESPTESRPRKRRRRRRKRRSSGGESGEGRGEDRQAEEASDGKPAGKGSSPKAVKTEESTKEARARTEHSEEVAKAPDSEEADEVAEVESTLVVPETNPGALEQRLLFSLPERQTSDERKIAMFCDFENIALGVRDSEIKKLDINLVLARLLEKGKIIVKKAYADWERYSDYKRPFHEAAIELIDIPQKYYSGKNSADIKLVVDAMDLCYSKEHLDTFVIASGDSDFSPLVSKLKENNKYVIGIGVKNSSSSLLVDNCDEFIYYEDVWRAAQQRPHLESLPPKEAEVFGLMSDAMLALIRENKEVLWGSMIKQTMQRKRPSFNESYYGYNTFSDLLEDAARKNIIGLKRDQRSGNYVVTGFIYRR